MKAYKDKFIWLLFWPAGALIYALARLCPGLCEHFFARILYRAFQTILSTVTGILPFSLAEIELILLIPAIVFAIVRFTVRLVRAGKSVPDLKNDLPVTRKYIAISSALRALGVLGIVFFSFVVLCGQNYFRSPVAESFGIEVEKSDPKLLKEMCVDYAKKASEVRERLTGCEDSEGVFRLDLSFGELGEMSRDAMTALGERIDVLGGTYPVPKKVLLSRGLSHLNITGFFFPFTVEANVNADIPDYSVAFVMCHELSHIKGFMREDEANFIGCVACEESDNDVLAYSGYMEALILSSNALYATDPQLYDEVRPYFSDGVRRDLADNSRYWAQFKDTKASEIGEKMNDTYLKANAQSDGTKSYGRAVDLLLARFKKAKNTGSVAP